MKVVVLTTIAYEPVDMAVVPSEVAEKCHAADMVICVYQDRSGESQVVATVASEKSGLYPPDIEVFDVV